jgi:hypothetical protein
MRKLRRCCPHAGRTWPRRRRLSSLEHRHRRARPPHRGPGSERHRPRRRGPCGQPRQHRPWRCGQLWRTWSLHRDPDKLLQYSHLCHHWLRRQASTASAPAAMSAGLDLTMSMVSSAHCGWQMGSDHTWDLLTIAFPRSHICSIKWLRAFSQPKTHSNFSIIHSSQLFQKPQLNQTGRKSSARSC